MKCNLTFILALLSGFNIAIAQTQTVTFKPNAALGEDVTLFDGFPNQNLEPYPSLINASWTCQSIPCTDRSLLRFDLTSIPSNATILSAHLSLFADLTQSVSPTPMYGTANTSLVQQITSAWAENAVTWNTQPTVTTVGQITLAQSSSPFQDYLNIDVTAYVAAWVATPASNFGILMRLQNETFYNAMVFASSDNADSSRFPELTVTYNTSTSAQIFNSENFNVQVFPNPFHHQLQLKLSRIAARHATVIVSDVTGKTVLSQRYIDLNNQEFLLAGSESLLPGIYTLEIKTDGKVARKKIVKL